jgi:hypothetical protein
MATAKEVLVRIEGRLDDGAKRFNRLEMMLWGVYPFILGSLALTKLL